MIKILTICAIVLCACTGTAEKEKSSNDTLNVAKQENKADQKIASKDIKNTTTKTAKTVKDTLAFRYLGPMLQMQDVVMVASVYGRTLRVEGKPINKDGKLMTNDEVEKYKNDENIDYLYFNTKTEKYYLVYPLAVGIKKDKNGCKKERWLRFTYTSARLKINEESIIELPYLGICGSKKRGIVAFHSPFLKIGWKVKGNTQDEYLTVIRSAVTRGGKHLAVEHLLELLHILGGNKKEFLLSGSKYKKSKLTKVLNSSGSKESIKIKGLNKRKPESRFIYVKYKWDVIDNRFGENQVVNVDYPFFGRIPNEKKRKSNFFIHKTWRLSDDNRGIWVQYFKNSDFEKPQSLTTDDPFKGRFKDVDVKDYNNIKRIKVLGMKRG